MLVGFNELSKNVNKAGTVFYTDSVGVVISKCCTKCKEIKLLDCFSSHKKGIGGKYTECKECRVKTRASVLFKEGPNGDVLEKQCRKCLKVKDITEFREHHDGLGGKWFKCLECEKMQNDYEVRGDVTVVIINSDKHGRLEFIIDTEDLSRVKVASTWFANPSNNPGRKSFYVHGYLGDGKYVQLHRYLLGINDPEQVIDHINRNPLDNRKSNLNLVTQAENVQNSSIRCDNTSGHKGVSWNKRRCKWRAYITVDKSNQISLGYYEDVNEAIKARKEAEDELFIYKKSIEELKESLAKAKNYGPYSKYSEKRRDIDELEAQ